MSGKFTFSEIDCRYYADCPQKDYYTEFIVLGAGVN